MQAGTKNQHIALRAVLVLLLMVIGCQSAMSNEKKTHRDINAVLRAHDRELLRLPNVVGVYVGLLPDNKTACLKVMLALKAPATERAIPKTIEGYPVVMEVTGEIRPMN